MEPEYTARSRTEPDRDDRVCRLAWCAPAIPHRRRQYGHAYQDFRRLSVAFADRQWHAHQPERRCHPVRELGRGFLLQCDANWNHEKTEPRVADAGLLYLGKEHGLEFRDDRRGYTGKFHLEPPVVRLEIGPCLVRLQHRQDAGRQFQLAAPLEHFFFSRVGLGGKRLGVGWHSPGKRWPAIHPDLWNRW